VDDEVAVLDDVLVAVSVLDDVDVPATHQETAPISASTTSLGFAVRKNKHELAG
jgi:hypothetical protein